jgi:hypothetical protein
MARRELADGCVRAVTDWVKALFAEQRDVFAGNQKCPHPEEAA